MELNSTKDLLCIVSPEKARNYKWRMPSEVNLQSIQIAPLEEVSEKFSFVDSNGLSVLPKESETYIRSPFEFGKFYENSFESAKQLEIELFDHFKEIAHLLGLKKFELQCEKSKKETTKTKVEVELKKMNLDVASFFCTAEYDPIPDITRERYEEKCYRKALDYAKTYNLFNRREIRSLLNARKPGTGMLSKLEEKYEFLSIITKSLDLNVNLEPIKNVLNIPSVLKELCPNGFNVKRTKEVFQKKMVSFKLEFYNYEN